MPFREHKIDRQKLEHETVKDLVNRVKSGDGAAFGILLLRVEKMSRTVACPMLGNSEDVKDVFQEACLRAFRAIEACQGEFEGWFSRIVCNLCIDHLRSRSRFRPLTLDSMTDPASSQITPLEQLQENEQHQILHDLMDTLSEKQRMVLKMFYFEGCSFDEIAESLEISLSDAKMQAHRGRKQLKTDLEEKLNDRPVGGHHE